MTEEEKIFAGKLFSPADPGLKAMKLKAHKLNIDFNALYEDETDERERILNELLGLRLADPVPPVEEEHVSPGTRNLSLRLSYRNREAHLHQFQFYRAG